MKCFLFCLIFVFQVTYLYTLINQKYLHKTQKLTTLFQFFSLSNIKYQNISTKTAQQNYKDDVIDPAVVVTFPCLTEGDFLGAEFLAWTTTPWTLPSNLALCVHPELIYCRFKDLTGKYSKKEN